MKLTEGTLKSRLLLEAPKALPDLRLYNRPISVARIEGRRITHGIKGQCDLYGIWKGGLHIELELKAPKGKLRPEQEAWRDWCREWGVVWLQLKAERGETEEQTVIRWLGEMLWAMQARNATASDAR
jgi:hypothetical protein